MKNSILFLLCFCTFAKTSEAAVQSVHTEIICPGTSPSVSAFFEQTSSPALASQSCRFLNLVNAPKVTDLSAWQASLNAVQNLTLVQRPSVVTQGVLRRDQVDGQGRIRKIIWSSTEGLLKESALFDENAHILQLDIWRNQTTVQDASSKPFVCGQSTENKLGIQVFNGGRSGNIYSEVAELENLADIVTDYALVHDLNLITTACTNQLGSATSENVAMSAAALHPGSPKGGILWAFSKPLVVAPNPVNDNALIFYQLTEHLSDVRLIVHSLSGETLKTYAQGELDAGIYQVPINVEGLSSGLYLVTLAGNYGTTEKSVGEFKVAIRH